MNSITLRHKRRLNTWRGSLCCSTPVVRRRYPTILDRIVLQTGTSGGFVAGSVVCFAMIPVLVPCYPIRADEEAEARADEEVKRDASDADKTGDQQPARYRSFSELRKGFIEANGDKRLVSWKELLSVPNADRIRRLSVDANNGIALCAAWARVQMRFDATMAGADRGVVRAAAPSDAVNEFLGFVEGRLRITAPDYWSQNLIRCRVLSSGHVSFPVLMFNPSDPEFPLGDKEKQAAFSWDFERTPRSNTTVYLGNNVGERSDVPRNIVLRPNERSSVSAKGDDSDAGGSGDALLPDRVAEAICSQMGDSWLAINGICSKDEKKVVLIVSLGYPDDCKVFCLDTLKGQKGAPRLCWERQLNSSWHKHWKGTTWFTEVRVDDDCVFVFTSTHYSLGIEAIRFADGGTEFSFSTDSGSRDGTP